MPWKPIVVGVDGSAEAANAAAFAVDAARRAATTFHLVHAVPTAERGRYPYTRHDEQIRMRIVATLGNRVPEALAALTVHGGQPAALLDLPQPDAAEQYRLLEEMVARDIWPLIRAPGVDALLRHGAALETVEREASEWRADLLVVGSHGKGSVKRMVVGSVTERLINHLPTSLLVVPAAAAAVEPEAREAQRGEPSNIDR